MAITTTFDHLYYPGDMVGSTFISALVAALGGVTAGYGTATGEFAQATAGHTSVMLAEAAAFWTTGIPDTGTATAKTGLSASTPYEFFEAFHSGASANGVWRRLGDAFDLNVYVYGPSISGLNWAKGLRALPTFTTAYDYLMAFDSNAALETAATASPTTIAAATTGEYDPTLALATNLAVSGTYAAQNGSSRYDWATTGLMAAIQTTRNPARLQAAKDEIARPRRRYVDPTPRSGLTDWLGLRGQSGLDFQVSFTDTIAGADRQVIDVMRAAMVMGAYRHTPQAWTLQLPGLT